MKHARDLVGRPSVGAAQPAVAGDPRWRIINLVVGLREELGLTGSDIAALRGMVFLLPREAWGRQMIVHASNRLLAERSDAMNERTLRRAILRLSAAGLVTRRDSSNRKRYRVTLEPGEPPVCFGIDLSPLSAMTCELERRLEIKTAEAAQSRSLRTLIRHRIYLLETAPQGPSDEILAPYRALLRRRLRLADLREAYLELGEKLSESAEMSGSDSQNVRHIQSSSPEYKEESTQIPKVERKPRAQAEVTVEDCLTAASTAVEFAVERPRSWADLCQLSDSLAPGLGIERDQLDQARSDLGPIGYCLAILGLIQAMDRIASPSGYLAQLTRQSRENALDLGRMFRSLTRRPRPIECLPG